MNGPIITDGIGKDRLWPFGNRQSSTMRSLEAGFRASLGLSGRLKDAKSAVEASGKFSQRGAADEHRRLAREQHLPHVIKGTIALERARKSVAEWLAKLTPKPADKTDLVAFFRRESIRDELRRMPREQRDNLLVRNARELDPEIAAAVLETVELPWTPPQDRLVSPETRTALARTLIAADHADELASIDELQAAIEYAAPTLAAGKIEIQAEIGINDREFAQLAQAENVKTVIWLNRSGDLVRVLLPEQRTPNSIPTRPATAEEIERGTFFKNMDEYEAAIAAAA
jgi:hypothetical protein